MSRRGAPPSEHHSGPARGALRARGTARRPPAAPRPPCALRTLRSAARRRHYRCYRHIVATTTYVPTTLLLTLLVPYKMFK